jgi:uncharacterized protein involved in exopolysaccharide biosynthesis
MSSSSENQTAPQYVESLFVNKFLYLKKRWWMYLLGGVVFAVLGFVYAQLQTPQYKSRLTFALDDGSGSETSLNSLASQFGLSLGSNVNVFGGDNIIEIIRSRRMVERVLLSVDTINNKPITLIENYMNVKGRKQFHPKVANIHFPAFQDKRNFTYLQDSVLRMIYTEMITNNINVEKPDRKYNIYEINIKSPNEHFSKVLTDRLIAETNVFYIELKTKKAKMTLEALENRIASVKDGLYSSISSRAEVKDANINPVFEYSQVPIIKQHTNIELYSNAYSEMYKNLEIARFQYLINTPLLQIIDFADYPMERVKMSRLKTAIVFSFLFVVVFTVVLLIMEQNSNYNKKGTVRS